MSRIFSLACGMVAVLATAATLVVGFSTSPNMVLDGWKAVDIHGKLRNTRLTHQLYMSTDKESEDYTSSDKTVEDMPDVTFVSEESEETVKEELFIDEAKETEDEVVMDSYIVEEDEKVEENEAGDNEEEVDESELTTVVMDEVNQDVHEAQNEEEEENVVLEGEDGESEPTTIASDETNEGGEKEQDTVEEEDVESETVPIAIDESEEVDDKIVEAEDGGENESSVVAMDEEGMNSDVEDSDESNDESDEEEVEIIAEGDGSSGPIDELMEGGNEDTDSTIVEPTVYFASQDNNSDGTFTDDIQESLEEKPKGLDIELIANVASDIAKDVLSVLRFGAANLLTSSLPENQRQDLLKRMGATALPPASETVEDMEKAAAEIAAEKIEEERASIQEEIAIARAEEAQKSEKKWEQQKEEILQEMEIAASARVENELKIQKMKLEEETAKSLLEKDQALQQEKERLENAIQKERERFEALEAEKAAEVDNLFAVKTEEEISRNAELEALMEKRQNQQAALESIEEELRASVASEEEQREQLQAMFEKRQNQQEELNEVEANLRVQVKEIESEKARYQKLVDGLKAMKEKAQELQQEADATHGDSVKDAETEEAADEESSDDDASQKEPDHPVLGPVVVDLGYKRIHLVSAGKLGTIPVWNRNRTYRNNRAKSMATEKIKSMELGFPGVIGLHEAFSGKLSIVDGQHRIGMMAALKEAINKKIEKGHADDTYDDVFDKVLVEVYPEPESSAPADGDAFAEKVFLEINKAEPVKLIDMPGVASAADRQVITEAVETLQDQFRAMFSSSQRCRIPNVNVDNLRSMIFGANILKRHKLSTSKKLLEWLLEQNSNLGDEYENDKTKQKLISKKQWTKASANNFYLGLESSWLYK